MSSTGSNGAEDGAATAELESVVTTSPDPFGAGGGTANRGLRSGVAGIWGETSASGRSPEAPPASVSSSSEVADSSPAISAIFPPSACSRTSPSSSSAETVSWGAGIAWPYFARDSPGRISNAGGAGSSWRGTNLCSAWRCSPNFRPRCRQRRPRGSNWLGSRASPEGAGERGVTPAAGTAGVTVAGDSAG